jgi:TfoX N-terminal domain
MVASDAFAEFLRDQLAPLGRITMRRMFGKTGVFCDAVMFGMVTENTLYFRVDDQNRATFQEAESFQPREEGRHHRPLFLARNGCSTNPMSSSAGRERRWRRRGGSRRRENGRRQIEGQSLNGREGGGRGILRYPSVGPHWPICWLEASGPRHR